MTETKNRIRVLEVRITLKSALQQPKQQQNVSLIHIKPIRKKHIKCHSPSQDAPRC